jgi:hypothetical protein
MKKWDYTILIVPDEIDPERMVQKLSEMGKYGWEAVSLTPKVGVAAFVALLKRPSLESAATTAT